MKPGSRSDLFAVARRASSPAGVFAAVLAAVLPGTAGLRAQNLELRTAPPPAVQMVCPWTPGEAVTPPAPGSAAAGEMERLTGAATQAMILGDLPGALEFLDRALERDPDAPEALYLRGRILVEQGDDDAATASFCRYLQVAPSGASAAEARSRLAEAVERGAAADLYAGFAQGVERYAAGDLEGAEAAFSRVLDARPGVTSARYNRAVVRSALHRPGAAEADLIRYMELQPTDADDADARALLAWVQRGAGAPSPGAAFALGVLVPGGGQYYTRRPLLGTTLLGLAGAAVATGYLHERTTILCRQPDPDGGCPSDQVSDTRTERPWLVPAIGAAAALTLASAIEAAIHAGHTRRPPQAVGRSAAPAGAAERVRLIQHGGSTAVRIDLLHIRVGGPPRGDRSP